MDQYVQTLLIHGIIIQILDFQWRVGSSEGGWGCEAKMSIFIKWEWADWQRGKYTIHKNKLYKKVFIIQQRDAEKFGV
jgi:hypothetical protein